PTNTPSGPTNTPGGATNTPVPPSNTPGGATNTPVTPSNTPSGATNTPVTPTNTQGPATNTPTINPNEPPLAADKVSSVSAAAIGQNFSFSISVFSSSSTARTITIRDQIDPQLTILSASASNGTCPSPFTNNTVVCSVNARSGAPATVNIQVQVSANATPGNHVSNQAIVSDDQSHTVLSDRVFVDIISGQPTVGSPAPTSTVTPV